MKWDDKPCLIYRAVAQQWETAFPVPGTVPPLAVAITTEKLALFSLGTFLAYQGHLAGPSASLSLSHLVFPLVPIS